MGDAPVPDHSAQVREAVEVVRVQAGCSLQEAFVLMHERATMSRMSMEDVIGAVVDGSIRFDLDAN